ncbi:dCTP deaminase [Candidatus Geothermarchaeota archaeon]|nr:MAG: dCTP deaminase [Candidatus Geothermarchaeota archaeon]RLG60449.1 MAG: dCTP deaminase [Candidatus Geothermarchaeota archaeon]HEW94120.1 dCTP deaminase [Thermoprotei archaeon]
MILSDVDILKAIERGEIKVIPFNRENLGPCSLDLTLDIRITVFRSISLIDPFNKESILKAVNEIEIDDNGYEIAPGEFILGMTKERIMLNRKYAATLEGLSSLARIGIIVHAAGLVNPGTGMIKPSSLVLEISNRGKSYVLLKPGMRIVQIMFHKLSSESSVGYDERKTSKYVGQEKAV